MHTARNGQLVGLANMTRCPSPDCQAYDGHRASRRERYRIRPCENEKYNGKNKAEGNA